MSTGFQPTAFQSDSFQIAGGVATSDVIIGINVTQDGDSCGLTVNFAQTDVTGGWPIYIPRRKKRVQQVEPAEEVTETAEAISARIATKITLDRARRRDAAVVAELKALYAEQDMLSQKASALKTAISDAQEDENVAILLALAS